MSTCVKCGNHLFKVQQVEPAGSQFILYFVQCSSCGVPVGVMEYNNVGASLEELENKIDHLSATMDQMNYEISNIRNSLR